MNGRAMGDAKAAVGGMWEEIGSLQLEILRDHGLTPQSTVLDIGCGSLRGGRKIVAFLDPGNYWGTEIAEGLLEAGRRHLDEDGLSHREPNLLHVRDFDLRELGGRRFDFILIFGVFTDVPPGSVRQCFAGLAGVMGQRSVGLATFGLADRLSEDFRRMRFRQPVEFYRELGREHGLEVELVPGFSFRHPKAHSLLRFALSSGA